MLLNGFQLEILVNGIPLKEYTLPINESRCMTGPSYVLNETTRQNVYSDDETYVAVKPEARYSIRFSSTTATMRTPLKAHVYVDGEHDYTCREISSSVPIVQDSFMNCPLKKKYYFKFEISQLSEIDNLEIPFQRKPYGGIGAISVYFYKAKFITPKKVRIPNYSVSQVQVVESKSTCDIKFTTAFEESNELVDWQDVATMKRLSHVPVAVLHLHYRPATWLLLRGYNVPEIDQPNHLSPSVARLSRDIKPDIKMDIKDIKDIKEEGSQIRPVRKPKYKIIRASVVHSDNIIDITEEDENRISDEVIDLENYTPKNKKRKYTKEFDIIKLLDSEEEEENDDPPKIICID